MTGETPEVRSDKRVIRVIRVIRVFRVIRVIWIIRVTRDSCEIKCIDTV